MIQMNTKRLITLVGLLPAVLAAAAVLFALPAHAAAPGITGPTFNLTAQPAYISQPDGAMIYSWGYGCRTGFEPTGFLPSAISGDACTTMQVLGLTLLFTAGTSVTVRLS